VASAVQHMAIVVQVPSIAVQLGVVAEPMAVQQDNAVQYMAIVVPLQNTVAVVAPTILVSTILASTILVSTILVSTILAVVAYAVPQVVQRERVAPHMAFVETLLPIAEEELPITAVTTLVAVLVSAAHNMELVPVLEPTVLPPSLYSESSHLRSKANSKEKRHITMRPWPGRTTAHVVQVELVH
jgi:hypothetical protein